MLCHLPGDGALSLARHAARQHVTTDYPADAKLLERGNQATNHWSRDHDFSLVRPIGCPR